MYRAIVTILFLGVLSGCVATQNSQQLEREVQKLRSEVRELKTDMKQLTRLNQIDAARKIETLGRQQAELQAGIDTIKVEAQSVRGRVDDQLKRGRQLSDEVNIAVDDVSLRMSSLEERLARYESTMEQSGVSLPSVSMTGAVVATVATAAIADGNPDEQYRQGVDFVRSGDFVKGIEILQGFIANNSDHALKVNAEYWIGEALYGQNEFEKAIIRFQDIISLYKSHPKVPSAILKQGLSFYALHDEKNARLLLERVIQEFSGSPEAKKAKERLEKW